jgi:hypothetical protein
MLKPLATPPAQHLLTFLVQGALDNDSGRDTDTADPGIIPGGIRDRALRAVLRRGPQHCVISAKRRPRSGGARP